jgi:predicted extracellular nuclease
MDDEYTPTGYKHWTYKRYLVKLRNMYKVIVAAGAWSPPDIIGLCEVENRTVLEDLISETPLDRYSYRIIHKNSPDKRGIDVAVLYNPRRVEYLKSRFYSVAKPGLLTRDILCFKALLGSDTCYLLVNHWPSRSEGQIETEPDRFAAAKLLKLITDSILSCHASAKILIMGDFNDEPADKSLVDYLKATTVFKKPLPSGLYNLTFAPSAGAVRGTLKYQGLWNSFDQIIVSGSYLLAETGLTVTADAYRIFADPFLLVEDKSYNGSKPYRTYNGFKYQGGFSDHLPVFIDLESHR